MILSFKPTAQLKLISWNSGRKSIVDSLGYELQSSNRSMNVLFSVAETSALTDLSSIGLVGWRHGAPLMRGMCVYISRSLQHFTTIRESSYTLSGTVNFPSQRGFEAVVIGFVCSYRSPEITDEEALLEYFADVSEAFT